jgi:hypothetical protein
LGSLKLLESQWPINEDKEEARRLLFCFDKSEEYNSLSVLDKIPITAYMCIYILWLCEFSVKNMEIHTTFPVPTGFLVLATSKFGLVISLLE